MLQRTHKTNSDRYWTKTFPSTDIVMPKFVLDMLDCDILLHFSSFCLKLDNFFQISSFFIYQNKIDALLLALIKVKTVNLSELAVGFGGKALKESNYKR